MPPFLPPELLAAVAGAILSAGLTWVVKRRGNKLTEYKLNVAETDLEKKDKQIAELGDVTQRLSDVRSKLGGSIVIRRYEQPVILLGPRGVGKSSLLTQWHTPWDRSRPEATFVSRTATVPFYNKKDMAVVPHFADPTVSASVTGHFALRVHDFPGEISAQAAAVKAVTKETAIVLREVGREAGVVLVCMFDAAEAIDQKVSHDTNNYYNGELFGRLDRMIRQSQVAVHRVIVVFNKFDQLEEAFPDESVDSLVERCEKTFERFFDLLEDCVHRDRVFPVATVLTTGGRRIDTKNASIVLGEAARGIVEKALSKSEADAIIAADEADRRRRDVVEAPHRVDEESRDHPRAGEPTDRPA